jgi:mannose/fructose-specific phosphotransferase system component IIA
MSTPPNTGATELGETRKLFGGKFAGNRAMRDLTDTGQVFLLATEIAGGSARRVTMLSLDEMRAIANLAAGAGVVLHLAVELVAASDRGADMREMRARLEAICKATRALTTKGAN